MGVQGLSFSYVRYQAIDYTVAYNQEPTTILIPSPIEESRLLVCVRPFQWQV